MHEIDTMNRVLGELAGQGLLNKPAASLAMGRHSVSTEGLISARERFICGCIASMHDRLVREEDIGARCAPPALRFDGDPETYLFTPVQAVNEATDIWLSYGLDPSVLRIGDRPLRTVAAEVVASYKRLIMEKYVLDIRDEHEQESSAVTDARHRYLEAEGLPFSTFRWTRPESRSILAMVPITDPVDAATLDRAVRAYLARQEGDGSGTTS